MRIDFRILHKDHKARFGIAQLVSGRSFETPNFMPVGTRGTVKGIDCERLSQIGAQIILVNTYHLMLRPGANLVSELGGIHKFTGWYGPILSDSGGFQVFSLKSIRKITEDGVEFRSQIDGKLEFLSPERSITVQNTLGVDIAMAFDECPASTLSEKELEDSLGLTLRWAKRSLAARPESSQMALFGITQGGLAPRLRARSAEDLSQLSFDGYGIGGLSVGETSAQMYDTLSYHVDQLPFEKIRYLMGVGTPRDIVEAVKNGVDLFDCVMPTRAGRCGRVFLKGAPPYINIRNSKFANDGSPLDQECTCLTCKHYSRGYLHHLFRVNEMLGPQLVSLHNLFHYLDLMKQIRSAIQRGIFDNLYRQVVSSWQSFLGGNEFSQPKVEPG
ncbi:MAG TPA: tRNA guanosine(34) transglycosylase Tgt [Oligoflexia bacterium]|nr:tRNA guanosine(34) transglycosylase Tgt [Oligoflexia bacterium]HMP26532.1 tRNA guanosine(34) transglycosylase Tgt [Oligoflexia bacterium]